MQAIKRVEIVADAVELHELVEIIERSGASGYTIIRDVQGKGGRGLREGDTVTDALRNHYILVACPDEVARVLVENIRPILKRYGGICLVSDAQYLLH